MLLIWWLTFARSNMMTFIIFRYYISNLQMHSFHGCCNFSFISLCMNPFVAKNERMALFFPRHENRISGAIFIWMMILINNINFLLRTKFALGKWREWHEIYGLDYKLSFHIRTKIKPLFLSSPLSTKFWWDLEFGHFFTNQTRMISFDVLRDFATEKQSNIYIWCCTENGSEPLNNPEKCEWSLKPMTIITLKIREK